MANLPIDSVLDELHGALASHSGVVLIAAPGAGKTTRVPLSLLDAPWLDGRKIVMLEPRRLAARSAARFMARSLGESVGATVGYRVRLDTQVGPKTRIEVVTEGVLTRMLQSDPALEDVGLLIFDEFHERNLQADLGLALSLETQSVLREDLRLLVMSATLEAEPVAQLLGGAPVVTSEGRSFPVETRYLARPADGRIEPAAARVIVQALAEQEGDLLVFLPGAGEIRRTAGLLAERGLGPGVKVAPLYGMLPQEAQDAALAPCAPGTRKVVLATSIAESSLTVEGVRVVIDSGLMRVPRFSPRTGMSRLETVSVSAASADQRRGRAGRLAPGVCYRLWSEADHRQLPPQRVPEIREADLAPLALELAAWGAGGPDALPWLDPPPAGAYAQAAGLLQLLEALDGRGAVTVHGRAMAALGLHPRLAHMLLRAKELGLGGLACDLAALLGERDVLGAADDADLRSRVELLRSGGRQGRGADDAALQRIAAEAKVWRRELGLRAGEGEGSPASSGVCLALAYPERIGQNRGGGRYLLSSGRGAVLPRQQLLWNAAYIVAAELDDQGAESRIRLAAPLEEEELRRGAAGAIRTEESIAWDRGAGAVRGRRRELLGALLLKETVLAELNPERQLQALLEGIRLEGLGLLPWSKAARQLRERIGFLHRHRGDFPNVSDEALLGSLEEWLAPHLYGMKSRGDLQRVPLFEALESLLPWPQRQQLGEFVPTHVTVPSGSRIPVDYSDPDAPALAVRLQELFGLRETPRIAGGKVGLVLHLLSPAQRPVQVTKDLASFWREGYFEVKKDLKGRYPKHYWPDDPLEAVPTSRVRPRT
ncbi:ATP-dependent helicase HrpB [Paenibacillus mucilaginosus]|uniref:ATP-dependent helicase HrpB n=2 Tax=Paenibacillus mucilaginosus TaxID=61624 RepID=UPI001EF0FE28|nr:ATP-dependent helicase HrpB [Paenibacillus mucilaginosus]MCG7216649.1 ATP-dependent helicase HrpB [Paenibacillus mucilaginosus]WDM25644.1 ATP-dependent helicase HrpB [Paenibacillus mucilaginosus]